MAPPDKRAVAPGEQPIRSDNVKAKSWVNVRRHSPLIGQIFFATDNSILDNHDMEQLDIIDREYRPKLNVDPKRSVYFTYLGFADYRYGVPSKKVEYNRELSQKRADAVGRHLGDSMRLGGFRNYVAEVKGLGIDYNGIDRPPDSKELEEYRRVDILADPVDDPQWKPPPKDEQLSTKWKARMFKSASASPPFPVPFQYEYFSLEIVDLTNNIGMTWKYKGLGLGKGWKHAYGSLSVPSSDWFFFNTNVKVNIMDFEGGAWHLSAQLQAGPGGSYDAVRLEGPEAHRPGCTAVKLQWYGITKFDKALGAGGGLTGGGIDPNPPGQKPYPAR
jgi:hypothetical protein